MLANFFSHVYTLYISKLLMADTVIVPWKFDVLKPSVFKLEASLLRRISVLTTSNLVEEISIATSTCFLFLNNLFSHIYIALSDIFIQLMKNLKDWLARTLLWQVKVKGKEQLLQMQGKWVKSCTVTTTRYSLCLKKVSVRYHSTHFYLLRRWTATFKRVQIIKIAKLVQRAKVLKQNSDFV